MTDFHIVKFNLARWDDHLKPEEQVVLSCEVQATSVHEFEFINCRASIREVIAVIVQVFCSAVFKAICESQSYPMISAAPAAVANGNPDRGHPRKTPCFFRWFYCSAWFLRGTVKICKRNKTITSLSKMEEMRMHLCGLSG